MPLASPCEVRSHPLGISVCATHDSALWWLLPSMDYSDTPVQSSDTPVQSRDTHVKSRDPPVLTSDTQASAIAISASSGAPLALPHPKKSRRRRRRNRRSTNENSAPRSAAPVTPDERWPIGIRHPRERPSINQRPVTPPR